MGGPSLEPHGDTLSEPGVETCRDTMTVEPVTGDSSDHAQSGVEVEPGAERHGDSARVHKHPDTHPDTRPGIASFPVLPIPAFYQPGACEVSARLVLRLLYISTSVCLCVCVCVCVCVFVRNYHLR